jgi:hypothetical protein
VAERGQFLVALVGEVGDQADRLQELEHATGGARGGPLAGVVAEAWEVVAFADVEDGPAHGGRYRVPAERVEVDRL